MYEENCQPLPSGDFAEVFAQPLTAIADRCPAGPPARITPADVVRWANPALQPYLAGVCRRLLLPGSGILGVENLARLSDLAAGGESCIVCLNHQSNLDVPTLHVLLEDQGLAGHFDRLIWIAGRKLHEDAGATHRMVQAYHHLIVSPRSWMKEHHTDEELHEAHQLNASAYRAMHRLRGAGWMFGMFPAATRLRPHDAATRMAIRETDSYLKTFRYLLLGRIDGCTLPVSRDRDLTHETPRLDRVRYSFAPVVPSNTWRARAAERYPQVDQRQATSRAIIEDIEAIPVL
jgi:hypothetical protein